MKKLFLLFLIPYFSLAFSQQTKNRFDQEDRTAVEDRSMMGDRSMQNTDTKEGDVLQKGPGNPGDPVPVDNYIPFLIITALGLIIYQVRREKKVQ